MKAFKAKFGNDSLTMMFKTSADNVEVLSENEGRFNCGRILQIVLLLFVLLIWICFCFLNELLY